MGYSSDKNEIFKNIDMIYKKLRYQRRKRKIKIEGKEIWQELYEIIPYYFIRENEEILDLIVNICKENYKDSITLLKELISEYKEIKCYESNKVIYKEDIKQIENKKIQEDKIKQKNKYNVKSESKEYVLKKLNNKENEIDAVIDEKYSLNNSLSKNETIVTNDKVLLNAREKEKYNLERVKGKITPHRKEIKVNKVVRNVSIVKTLKAIYNDTCQICGTRLEIAPEVYYS